MDIQQLISDLQLIAEDSNASGNTPVAVCFVDRNGDSTENPIYKTANNCSLKKVRLMGSDEDVYAIVLS